VRASATALTSVTFLSVTFLPPTAVL